MLSTFDWILAWLCVMAFVCGAVPGMATFLGRVFFSGFTIMFILSGVVLLFLLSCFWWPA